MIYTEITPNPASLKFVVERTLMKSGSADFPDVSHTADAPIAKKLFDFRFVEGVFIGDRFITITKSSDFQWEEIIPTVKDFLKAYFASNQPILEGAFVEEAEEEESNDDETTKKIKELLESHVRPAVAMDGGDIIFEGFDEGDGILKLRLQGSCSGCPSSTITLKQGIEGLMTRMVPQVKSVEAV
ncbi:NifU family protein [Pontibacter sp. G13]|uniref:NifU family protein n=1 Tax=Pontibacter sp. G13 TaxID=3074898 RepID=UPI00288BA477|nr:NifU family protein [Pontibacter sp. G13]WNJ19197.1 NifU family protein [Pontibacter sp. G13]